MTSLRASGYRKSSASGAEWALGERRASHGHPRPAPSTRTKHPTGHARARGSGLAPYASEGCCGTWIVDGPPWSLR
jgi:hypothetical protein